MASDFHTHHPPAPGVRALISGTTPVPGNFNSLQYHPWHLPDRFSPPEIVFDGFDALGEVGLDKLRGPDLTVQQEYLRFFLGAAQDSGKPVVLHIVRCYQELFELIKPFRVKLMLHGFSGSVELLKELWKRDITVSFSPKILSRQDLLQCLAAPAGPFGFESDDNPAVNTGEILKQCRIKDIETVTDHNFKRFIMR